MRGRAAVSFPAEEPSHHGRDVGPGSNLGDQLEHLTLRPVRGPFQQRVRVLLREVRCQQRDSSQVKAALLQQGQEHGVLSRGAGDRDAQIGFRLREVQDLRAVDEHGGAGLTSIEPAPLHFSDVGDEVGFDAAGLLKELGQAAEQLFVRDRFEGAWVLHEREYRPCIFDLLGGRVAAASSSIGFRRLVG
jgi:hypothetical protein